MTKRERLYPEIKRLREDEGLTWREIGERVGLNLKLACHYYNDPAGDKARARKARNDGSCVECGAATRSGGAKVPPTRCAPCSFLARKEWTREVIVDALRRWAEEHDGEAPSASDWNATLARESGREERSREYPSTNTVRVTFGTWNAALAAAGFPPNRSGRPEVAAEELEETLRMYRAGFSGVSIAEAQRISVTAVYYRLAKLGEPRRPRGWKSRTAGLQEMAA